MNATEKMRARTAVASARAMSTGIRKAVAQTGLPSGTSVEAQMARLLVEACICIEEIAGAVDDLVVLGARSHGLRWRSALAVSMRRQAAPGPIAAAATPQPPAAAPPTVGPRQAKASPRKPLGRDVLPAGMSVTEQQRIARSASADEPWERKRRVGGSS